MKTPAVRRFLLSLVLLVLVGNFALGQVAPLNPRETVRVAYVPIMKFAPLYVAAERGLFDALGLDVEINRVASGTEAIAFLTEGQIDVGGIAIVTSLWNGWNQGLNIRVIAPGGLEPFENSPTKLMVRAELHESGAVTSIADLRGRTVAVAGGPGSGGEYLAAKALERAGLTIRDVNLINVANPDMPASFEGGAIDAGILGSPYAQQVQEAGFGVELAGDLTPGAMTVAFVGSDNFVSNRPEVAQRFALALMQAARLMQGEDFLSEENVNAYLTYVSSTPEAVAGDALLVFDPNQQIPVRDLADVERTHRENGRTEYTDELDLSNVVNTSFTEWALLTLGIYGE
ncbi:MAG: ABC transporter substrate-binding protein [Trueperaceae bacterium]|nr:ABC transporter substrate-binding protein [Trueperaceae bacterium]